MAAPMSCQAFKQMSKVRYCPRLMYMLRSNCLSHIRHKSGSLGNPDPERLFAKKDVRQLLMKITGFDLNKIFKEHFTKAKNPKYELLTDEELEKIQQNAVRQGKSRLQMPPVMNPRSAKLDIISDDAEIDGHDSSKYVFTDITYGLPDKTRVIVLREPDGKLRHVTGDEQDRLLHIYFPKQGHKYRIPKMFGEQRLEEILQSGRYQAVLNRACIQFEPDDHNFVRITQRVYEHIADHNQYDVLRSTRFFGPMALYFTCHNKSEGLMVDMIQRDLLENAADVVKLHSMVFPTTKSALLFAKDSDVVPEKVIEVFAENDAPDGGRIQLALQAYMEARKQSTAVQ